MKFVLTGAFNELHPVREGRRHTGIDLAMPEGTTLRSVTDGVVYALRDYGAEGIGKGVIVKMNDGNYAIYGHMSRFTVEKGQKLAAGQEIGMSGNTGHSTGPHLHFAIQKPDGNFIDPTGYAEKLDAMSGTMHPMEKLWSGWDQLWGTEKIKNTDTMEAGGSVYDWFFSKLWEGFAALGNWFLQFLPEIVGYASIGAGIFIILASMVGKSGIFKALGWYFALVIVALCVLGSV